MEKLLLQLESLIKVLPDGTQEKDYYLNRLRHLKNACGCKTSAVFLIIAFITYPIYILLFTQNIWERIFFILAQGFLALVLSALMGKLIGIAWSKIELVFLFKKLSYSNPT